MKKKNANRRIGVEVGREHLRLVSIDAGNGRDQAHVTGKVIRWRDQAQRVDDELGRRELFAAWQRLSAEFRLDGQPVSIVLSADFCVMRVITGTESEIRGEIAQLVRRASRFLVLGRGERVIAHEMFELDARHRAAIVAITNREILDTLFDATREVGARVQRIEPSAVALCRGVGKSFIDHEAPTLIAVLDNGVSNLVLSYHGRPVLDYHPSRSTSVRDVATIVAENLSRMQRYCNRYYRHAAGDVEKVLLCGNREQVAESQQSSGGNLPMAPEPILPSWIQPADDFTPEVDQPEFVAALGGCLEDEESIAGDALNLKSAISVSETPRARGFVQVAVVAAAAALLLSVGTWTVAGWERARTQRISHRLAALADGRQTALACLEEKRVYEQEIEHIQAIRRKIVEPSWRQVIETIAQCLPPSTWLGEVKFADTGQFSLDGASVESAEAYEFADWLSRMPGFAETYVEGTRPMRLPVGEVTAFEIESELLIEVNENGDPAKTVDQSG